MEAERELYRGKMNKFQDERSRGVMIVTNQCVILQWDDGPETRIELPWIRIIFASKNIRETGIFSRKVPGLMIDARGGKGGSVMVLEAPDAAEIVEHIRKVKPGL
jgi:hypothetical protein